MRVSWALQLRSMGFDVAGFRKEFPALQAYVWLNTAGIAPGATPVVDAMQAVLEDWRNGTFDSQASYKVAQDTRGLFANLIGAEENTVSLLPTAAAGVATVAASLAREKPRGKIVVGEKEFRSNLFPWQALGEQGFVVENVKASNGVVSTEALLKEITPGTILVAISDVQFSQGYRVDLAAVAEPRGQCESSTAPIGLGQRVVPDHRHQLDAVLDQAAGRIHSRPVRGRSSD